ncbi:MAG: hypothetical protein KAF91_02540 [Nostoc sp. TH1S01]|nr:hypothetical protein [Nostoc sp. TH1S01]
MKRQSCIGIATFIFAICLLSNIDSVRAELSLEIDNTALDKLIFFVPVISSEEAVIQTSNGELSGSFPPTLVTINSTINKPVSRSIENLWKIVVPKGSTVQPAEYSCGIDSENNNFTHSVKSNVSIPLNIVSSPQTTQDLMDGTEMVQGGLTFKFNISDNIKAGTYICNLHITVKVDPPTNPNL